MSGVHEQLPAYDARLSRPGRALLAAVAVELQRDDQGLWDSTSGDDVLVIARLFRVPTHLLDGRPWVTAPDELP